MEMHQQNRNNKQREIDIVLVYWMDTNKGACFDPFIHWLIKQTNETLIPKPFSKVIRKSL